MGSLTWILARTSGLGAWAVLTASVLTGLVLSTGRVRRSARQRVGDAHTVMALAGLGLVAVHLAALVADSYVEIGPLDLLVPFASAWRPVAVAYGVVAMWAVAAVALSTALRSRLRPSTWRAAHLLSYLAYASATLHLVTAGTDAAVPAVQAVAAGSVVVVAALSMVALVRQAHRPVARPRSAPVAAAMTAGGSVETGTRSGPTLR